MCQAGILRCTTEREHDRNRILFSNPASAVRERMTVRLSYDEGDSWRVWKVLHEGPSGYSCLGVLPDMRLACLYECSSENFREGVRLATFTLEWLEGRSQGENA